MSTLLWYMQLTRVCNHKCVYCSNPSNWKIITMEWIKAQLKKLKEEWYTDVMLTWGEPTLFPKFFEVLQISNKMWIYPRVITNWIKFADEEFAKRAKENWISIVHMSVYTYKEQLNDEIRDSKWAYKQMLQAILNLKKYNIETQITTVISKYNQDHLLKIVQFLKKVNPSIVHFVWNVLDPLMMLQNEMSLASIPDLNIVKDEMVKTLKYLESIGNTFRIERIPLCKIPWYERCNTEARKLAKMQWRKVFFLDDRSEITQEYWWFRHDYLEACDGCAIKELCGWIWFKDKYYKHVKVDPITDSTYLEKIKSKILWRE